MVTVKTLSYDDKLDIIAPFFLSFVDTIRKDLKQEHLKKRPLFFKTYFPEKVLAQLTPHELAIGYQKALQEKKDTTLAEYLCNRWVLRNIDMYEFFESKLSEINPQFDQLESLDPVLEKKLVEESANRFTPVKTYLFCLINSVVLAPSTFEQLATFSKQQLIKEQAKIDAEKQAKLDLQAKKQQEKDLKKASKTNPQVLAKKG